MKSNVNISSYDKLVEEYIKTKAELEKAQQELAKLKGKYEQPKKVEKYYAVKIGRKPGIYTSWKECKKYVHKYDGAQFRAFKTLAEAENFMKTQPKSTATNKAKVYSSSATLDDDKDLPF